MTGLGIAGTRRSGRSVRVRALVASVAVTAALATTGCDLRWETDASAFPAPDAVTVARNSLADAESAVLAAATAAGTSADDVAADAVATAQTHLDVLGGVYVPYPGTTPSPGVSPAPEPTLSEAVDAVRATAESVAATTDDADLAFLARSIDLEWALRELWAARAPANVVAGEATVFPLADGTMPAATGFTPGAGATGLAQDALSDLALREDEARFAYETIAALEFDALRDDVLARSRLHAERSDAIASLLTSDPRTPLYQLRDANLPDPDSREALERSIEGDLGARYAALLDGASAADAAWLLNAAFDSFARAMATNGFVTADLPTLPGLKNDA